MADPEQLAVDLRLAIGRISRRVRQSHSVGELTPSELSVLARLYSAAASPTELAEQERVRPQAMATTLATLEELALVRRDPHPTDGRRSVLRLTPAGCQVMLTRRSESTRRLAEVLAAEFTADERSRLAATVELLARLADRL